jgi:hypothetical protein
VRGHRSIVVRRLAHATKPFAAPLGSVSVQRRPCCRHYETLPVGYLIPASASHRLPALFQPAVNWVRFAKLNLVGLIAVALAAYAFDCLGMTTPEQAMQCCRSMPCSSHGHHNHHQHQSQDCCKTMPSAHAALGQASSGQGISFFPVPLGVVRALSESHSGQRPLRLIVEHCHAPPLRGSPATLALRI